METLRPNIQPSQTRLEFYETVSSITPKESLEALTKKCVQLKNGSHIYRLSHFRTLPGEFDAYLYDQHGYEHPKSLPIKFYNEQILADTLGLELVSST